MSATASGPVYVLDRRGQHRTLDAFVVAARFDREGACAAFALGDGSIHMAPIGQHGQTWPVVRAHDGAVLSLAPDITPGGFLTGGDDGFLRRVSPDGSTTELARFGMKWVDHVASFADGKGGVIAASVGKTVHVFDAACVKLKALDHPSTVTGLAFDAKGKRIGASHYGGASLWFVAAKVDSPRKLDWKGSHIGIAIAPDGDAVVTAMQENALHGWRLSDGQHMRMSGYPAKTRALSFTRNGKWLATSGADAIVLWPFFGGGPMGKAPTELAGGDGALCTVVACNPVHEAVAAGFADGLVVLVDIASARVLPLVPPGRGAISALAWSGDGGNLAIGSETGFAAIIDFARR